MEMVEIILATITMKEIGESISKNIGNIGKFLGENEGLNIKYEYIKKGDISDISIQLVKILIPGQINMWRLNPGKLSTAFLVIYILYDWSSPSKRISLILWPP